MLTLGATSLYISAISVRVSVMEAAAKTTRSTLSAFASPWVSSVVVSSVLLPQAARENTSASARSRDKSFFMFGYFLTNFFFFAHSLKSAAIQERARTRRTQFISNSQSEELGQNHFAILKIDNAPPTFRARRREALKLSNSTDSFGSKIYQSCPPNPAPLGRETASQTFPRKGDAASVKRQSR